MIAHIDLRDIIKHYILILNRFYFILITLEAEAHSIQVNEIVIH